MKNEGLCAHTYTEQKVNTPPTTSTNNNNNNTRTKRYLRPKMIQKNLQPRMEDLVLLGANWKMREKVRKKEEQAAKKARFMTKTWVKRVIVIDAITLHAKIAKALQ